VVEHCALERLPKEVDESGGTEARRSRCAPHVFRKCLIGIAKGCLLGIIFVDPGVGVFLKKDGEIWNVAHALQNGIKITGISEIHETDLTFLGVHGDIGRE